MGKASKVKHKVNLRKNFKTVGVGAKGKKSTKRHSLDTFA